MQAGITPSVARLPWPFLAIADERGRDLPFALVQGPLETHDQVATLGFLRNSHVMIGATGLAEFPKLRTPQDRTDYAALCHGWCHCFRDPDTYLPAGTPRALISHSDFIDPARVAPAALCGSADRGYEFDFVYVCLPGRWQAATKNLALATACILILTKQLGMRGLLVGRPAPDALAGCKSLTCMDELPWRDLMQVLGRSRFLLAPNMRDASPRLLAESLCMDTPIVVNRAILGGWKYVNAFTGAFFSGEHDLAAAVAACLGRAKRPRTWFASHYGPYPAGARLADFLRLVCPDGSLDRIKCALPTDRVPEVLWQSR